VTWQMIPPTSTQFCLNRGSTGRLMSVIFTAFADSHMLHISSDTHTAVYSKCCTHVTTLFGVWS
jgi:hypothetical protein